MSNQILMHPTNQEQIIQSFKFKIQNRTCKMLLYITIDCNLSVREIVKLMITNGFDGLVVTNVYFIDDVSFVNKIIKYLELLPEPYEGRIWDVYMGVNSKSNITKDYIFFMAPKVTGVIIDEVLYTSGRYTNKENNLTFHSSILSDILCQDIIDAYCLPN